MEDQRFDSLSRRLAGARTRRGALKAIAGALVAGIAGTRAASAQTCAEHYHPCGGDDQCCAGAVCQFGLCMPGCRIDGAFTSAWMSPPDNICGQCRPEVSITAWTPANEGMSCWSGDPNAGITTCQQGVCRGTGPVDCRPQTACHTAAINPATGQCVQSFAPAGTPCGGQASCAGEFYTPPDACDGNGFCIGGGSQTRPCAPYVCGGGACTTSCQTDADCATGAHCDDGACFPDADLGQPCDEDSDCQSGMCAEGVCCNQRCEGLCETCSAETGGYCRSVVCDDGLSCTTGACDETTGVCVQTINPGSCLIAGVCYASGAPNPAGDCTMCDPARDQNTWSPCMDGGVCSNGACVTSISESFTQSGPHGAIRCGDPTRRPYATYTFAHAGGLLKLEMRGFFGGGGTLDDPLMALYTSYNPADPCTNLVAEDDDDGCGRSAYIEANLAAGTYTILATARVGTSAYGTYTITFGQDPAC